MRGLLFVVSAVWYRSAWKYRDRAYRYCLLDAGHILGGIEAGAYLYGHAWRIAYDIDLAALNRFFGFGEEERFLAAAICAVPEKDRQIELPDSMPPRADPLGGVPSVPNPLITRAYRETTALKTCRKEPRFSAFSFHKAAWEEAILKRRSIREFANKPISKAQFEALMEIVNLPVPSDCDEKIAIYAVLNRVEGMPMGVYREGRMVKIDDFSQKAGYLCLEQRLGSESAVIFFLLSRGCNYRALYQKAGLLGHRLYLVATYLGLGCSGIGAYYDDEVRVFLEDEGMVLYALAVG